MTYSNDSAQSSVYICKEIFDENSEPTKIEIEEQALRLGIDPANELHLLYIAKKCLLEPLPSDWLPCYIIKENKYFYYNVQSKTSQWEHPLDEHYRHIVEKIRSEDSSTGKDVSPNIILDEDNSLDTMYNLNYEKRNVTEKRTVRFKTPIEESLDLDSSDDNMKFLGPIKLNTPYNTSATSSILQNLPQFSTTNTFDTRSTGRSGLSKYNVLPSKDDILKKSDTGENINKTNDGFLSVVSNTGKENLRKIDITLTESSDRSESTSSEMHTDNLNTDRGVNGEEEKESVASVQMNSRKERIDVHNDERISANDHGFNKIHFTTGGSNTRAYGVKKDVSDSGNSTAKDSKIIQSSVATNSFSATKSKMTEITQRFPLNKLASETKPLKTNPVEDDGDVFDVKSIRAKSSLDREKNSDDERHSLVDTTHVKVIIEKHFDSIKNKLEDTIKTKETIFREEFMKQIDDIIRKQNDKFEKHIEARHNELFTKNELEFKNMIREKTGKLFIEECEKKCVENISSAERTCLDKLSTFQKDLENHAETFKKQIQSELKFMSDELKKEFCKNSGSVTDSLSKALVSYKNDELDKVKNDFDQTVEIIKRDTNTELHRFNQEFREKLKVISEIKLNDATDQLDLVLRDEIESIKTRVNRSDHDITSNVQPPTHKPPSPKLCVECSGPRSDCQRPNVVGNCCCDIRKKIQHCSNELNDTLKLVNEMAATSEYTRAENCLCSNKCTVSCQTENIMTTDLNPSLNKFIRPEESPNMQSILNNLYDVNSRYTDNYRNQARSSRNVCSNQLTPCSHMFSPLGILNREELKVNAAEQDICRMFDTFNGIEPTDVYRVPINTNNIHQNKFNNFYQAHTPKQIPSNRIRDLREWLYKTDLRNENKWS